MSNKAKIWLYKEGNECNAITGGWDFHELHNCTSYSANKYGNHMSIDILSGNTLGATTKLNLYTKNLINMQYFKNIVYDIDGLAQNSEYTRLTCYVSDKYNELGIAGGITIGKGVGVLLNSFSGRENIDLNVNEISGNKYCCVYLDGDAVSGSANNYINVYNIYANSMDDVIKIYQRDNGSISFTLNNFNNLISFTQVNILVNGKIVQSYTGNINDSITYNFGNNKEFTIQAMYTQGDGIIETAELEIDFKYENGIDENTILYLRGDSLVDLSLNKKSLTNNGITVASDKSLYCDSGNYMTVPNIGFTGSGDFTVEFYLKMSKFGTAFYPFRTTNYDVAGGISVEVNVNKLLQVYITGNGNFASKIIKYDITNYLNTYIHFAFCRKNGIGYMYINGIKVGESDLFNYSFTQNTATLFANENSTANIKHLRISNIARYSSDFTPPTKPYNSININITNQASDKIDFTVSKLGQEVINKVEVLVNDEIVQMYNEIGDLSYTIDKNIIDFGNNDIKIRVTYDDIYTEEIQTTYCEKEIINKLYDNKLDKIIQKQEEINNAMIRRRNYLLKILNNKGLTLNENIGFLDLINAVDQITNNNSEEVSNYISQISNLNSTIANLNTDREEDRQKLIEILQGSNMDLTGNESMDTLLDLIDMSNINLSEIKCLRTGGHTTFILKTDGSIWACGHNQYGILGLGHTNHAYVFTKLDIEDVKDVYLGAHYVFIMKNDGSIWCSGHNEYGQLGLGDTTDRKTFTQVNIDNVKKFYCGAYHVMALKNDGTLWSCGWNTNGELGLGDAANRNVFTQVNITDVKYVKCGYSTSFIIKNDGSVWVCGWNQYGQLGLGDYNSRTTFTQVTTNINNDVKEVSACQGYTYILKTNGEVYSCGRNHYGQLGLGTTSNKTTFTKVTTNTDNVKSIIHSIGFTIYFLKNDNTLWGCGSNDKGQLALNNTTNKSTFVLVCSDVKETASGTYEHIVILKNDNTLWGCGLNGEGQLGLGDSEHKLILTEIIISEDFLNSQIQKLNAEAIINKGNLSTVLTDEGVELTGDETLADLIVKTDEEFNRIEQQKDILKSILISKNVEVAEDEDELSILIDKVNDLGKYDDDDKLWLYKEGNEYISTTGGWEGVDTWSEGGSGLTFTKNSDNLEAYATYDCGGFFVKNQNMIDFTQYNKIYCDIEVDGTNLNISNGNAARINIKNNKPYNTTTVANMHIDTKGRNTYSIDVTKVTGNYYPAIEIYMMVSGYVRIKVYKIWLEK